MKEDLARVQDIFLDKINQICRKLGLNNVMAQLYAILYLSNEPISLSEMAERLKISKGSASINIRALERYNAVKRVWIKGSRKDFYEAESDIYKVIIDRIKSMVSGRLTEVDSMINSSYQILNNAGSTDSDERKSLNLCKEKVDKLAVLYKQAKSLLEVFDPDFKANESVQLEKLSKTSSLVSSTPLDGRK